MDIEIAIPEGVNVTLGDREAVVKGSKGEVKVHIPRSVKIAQEGSTIKVSGHKMYVHTVKALFRNSFKGVTEGHTKTLKILYSHFPMKLEVKGDRVFIKNYLGGRVDRVAKIVGNTTVKVKGQTIEVSGPDLYAVGQTAANLHRATRPRNLDERIFQDGIYVVKE